ncbi:imelysin [Tamilnaduibacter salinus]|uniref:Imelysin n=1 Tax=Tamilnaduibacter salinus TaxID=1484056 RepID=A0A2U1CU44_9GAMM|nr:imelysin family protein [Tamilnaduibacter salinus]PVY70362.1 imelysin [Tamilnaduibacter salinus]
MVRRWFGIGLIVLVLAGCDSAPEPPPTVASSAGTALSDNLKTLVRGQLIDSCDSASALSDAVNGLLNEPTPDSLNTAKVAWKAAHREYQAIALLYQLADTAPPHWYQGRRDPVDAHPILPGYLDQVPGYPNSGLVYSETPLTPSFLKNAHQSIDFYYLTLGFHPMEFLLWERPGEVHPAQIYESAQDGDNQGVRTQRRRRTLLRLIAERLENDLNALCTPPNQAYLLRALHQRMARTESVTGVLTDTLETTLGEVLERRQNHPSGQTEEGMPVAHSPWAGADMAEWQHLISDLRTSWLPALAEDDEPEALSTALQSLEEAIRRLPESPFGESIDPVLEALAQLKTRAGD